MDDFEDFEEDEENDYDVCPNCREQTLATNGPDAICLNCDYEGAA